MKLLRFFQSAKRINQDFDDEIVDRERAETLQRMADHALAELDIERQIAGLVGDSDEDPPWLIEADDE